MQTYRLNFDPSLVGYAGNYQRPLASSDPVKRIIARRAARELRVGTSLNFGFGASAQVASMIAESGNSADYLMTIEQGIHGGHMIDDAIGRASCRERVCQYV